MVTGWLVETFVFCDPAGRLLNRWTVLKSGLSSFFTPLFTLHTFPMTPIKKLLVANRSEIAIRVLRSATELGISTVAVYAHEDRYALHRFKADEAYQIGSPGEPIKSYLNIPALIQICRITASTPFIPVTVSCPRTRHSPKPARKTTSFLSAQRWKH